MNRIPLYTAIVFFIVFAGLHARPSPAEGSEPHSAHSAESLHGDDDHERGEGGHAPHDEERDHESGDEHHDEPPLTLSEARLAEFGARVVTAQAGVIRQQVTLPGEVQLNREAVAHIVPRFPAKVVKVLARTGDPVKAGQVLAVAESSDTLARFELQSLIDGTVIQRHITLGEVLDTDDTAFVVADLSVLWVDIDLYPKHIPQVSPGQAVSIAAQHGPSPVEARIDYVSPLVDERTRTGLARVFLRNDGRWKPGMFINATITLGEQPAAIVIPNSAVIDLENRKVVFAREGDRWQPRRVILGRKDAARVEVLEGLQAGERYVAEGGFVLKAQLQKNEFESGHHH